MIFRRLIIALLFLSVAPVHAQNSELYNHVEKLCEYLSGLEYAVNSDADVMYLDSLYLRALDVCNGDRQEALFALGFAVLPYKEIPIKIPLTAIRFTMPLLSVNEEIFAKKSMNVPRKLFFDSPRGKQADSDKPAHFFSSAFLAYSVKSYDLCFYTSYFVEAFEFIFKADGFIDDRDMMTNGLGYEFGRALDRGENVLPSQYFISYNLKYFQIGL